MLRWPFRKRRPAPPSATDPTLRLLQGRWQCGCCGEWFSGVPDIAADHPDPWPHGAGYEPNYALRTDGDFLSEDFCVLEGEHFMIRCVLEIPVHGMAENWAFGCWSSLSRPNFDAYVETFDSGEQGEPGPWFGWLCNRIESLSPDEGSVPLDVCPRPGRQRPRLVITDETHPLAIAQRDGLTPEDLLQILRATGHGPTLQ